MEAYGAMLRVHTWVTEASYVIVLRNELTL